jgi:hypothetical protein
MEFVFSVKHLRRAGYTQPMGDFRCVCPPRIGSDDPFAPRHTADLHFELPAGGVEAGTEGGGACTGLPSWPWGPWIADCRCAPYLINGALMAGHPPPLNLRETPPMQARDSRAEALCQSYGVALAMTIHGYSASSSWLLLLLLQPRGYMTQCLCWIGTARPIRSRIAEALAVVPAFRVLMSKRDSGKPSEQQKRRAEW